MRQNRLIHATSTYKDSFPNYSNYYLDDIDNKTVEKYDFLHTKMLNMSFINSMAIYFLTG